MTTIIASGEDRPPLCNVARAWVSLNFEQTQLIQLSRLRPFAGCRDFASEQIEPSQLKLAFGRLSFSGVRSENNLTVVRDRAQQANSVALKDQAFSSVREPPTFLNRRLFIDPIYDPERTVCRLLPGTGSRNYQLSALGSASDCE